MKDSGGSLPFQHILHLTDFSACSDAGFACAQALARANDAKLSLLHVVVPDALRYMTPASPNAALELQETWAQEQMQKAKPRLADVRHEIFVVLGSDVWSAVAENLPQLGADLIVVGTHGRTGLRKALMGSVAECILRRSTVPVLTVGPEAHSGLGSEGKFNRVLLATDFKAGSAEAACYAMWVAQKDHAELLLVHACDKGKPRGETNGMALSVAEALHRMGDAVSPCAENLRTRPEMLVEFGEAGRQIVEVAKRRQADLIVMGIREGGNLFAATHLERGTAHKVVTHAPCPVLTVRPRIGQAA